MVRRQFKTCDVFNYDLVCRLIELFDEQLHGVDLLLGLLSGLLHDRLNCHSVIVIVAIIGQMFVIVEENIANDRVDNVSRYDKFD